MFLTMVELNLFILFSGCICRRGLGAVRELRKGELILRVPKSALMTRESLVETQKLSASLDIHPCLSSIQVFLFIDFSFHA